MHPGSKDLMETVAQWCPTCDFPFSRSMGWERWGVLGVLSDFALYYNAGDILEVGVCESSIFLTKLAQKYNRAAYHCDIQRSVIENCLTVPGYFSNDYKLYYEGQSVDTNFGKIGARQAFIYCGSSDSFFKDVVFPPIALCFIDGDHSYEQVKKDFWNAFKYLIPNGYIFMHDTYPPNEQYLELNACGTVYKFKQELEQSRDLLEIFTFPRSAWDVGLTVCRKKPDNLPYFKK